MPMLQTLIAHRTKTDFVVSSLPPPPAHYPGVSIYYINKISHFAGGCYHSCSKCGFSQNRDRASLTRDYRTAHWDRALGHGIFLSYFNYRSRIHNLHPHNRGV